jgi:Zn finger protein HypA/HybF involved in hydrogenase expression
VSDVRKRSKRRARDYDWSQYEIHCPKCGELKVNLKKNPKVCPECGSEQAIIMHSRRDIRERFDDEANR